MEIKYSKKFLKQFQKSPSKVQKIFLDKQDIFSEDRNHPILRNHRLSGKFKNLRSINVTGDWRALYEEYNKEVIVFVLIGTHSQLY